VRQGGSTCSIQEEAWAAVSDLKRALRRFFGTVGKGCLFLETALRGPRAWAHVTCVPVPPEVEEDAALYFKQGLATCDAEWATHPAAMDTASKGLRRTVPSRFPYFHVEFGINGGYAHVVEDEEEWEALEILRNA